MDLGELEFKAEDFFHQLSGPGYGPRCEAAASRANALLRERLSRCPVVFCIEDQIYWATKADANDTHSARLVAITPIVRDTAESLWQEFIAFIEDEKNRAVTAQPIIDRAKRLLEKGTP